MQAMTKAIRLVIKEDLKINTLKRDKNRKIQNAEEAKAKLLILFTIK